MDETEEDVAAVVKGFHAKLRALLASGKSADELWREHIRDRDGLHAYSVAMQRLATGSWAGREDGGRISWCVEASGGYFSRHLEHLLLKDLRRLGHGMPTLVPPSLLPASADAVTETVSALHGRAWRLLDIGSCYNPFQAWPQFVVTAIDIAPATENVLECDFLYVDIVSRPDVSPRQPAAGQGRPDVSPRQPAAGQGRPDVSPRQPAAGQGRPDVSPRQPAAGQCYSPSPVTSPEPRTSSSASGSEGASPEVLRQLCGDHYDVVVFSLLLSYLPCTTQRLTCCVNAHRVLRLHGLLLVISPDSSHQNRHAALMVGWKHCIETVGFHRWKYEKQAHLHCMAFRKTQPTRQDYSEAELAHALLAIPQDSRQTTDQATHQDTDQTTDQATHQDTDQDRDEDRQQAREQDREQATDQDREQDREQATDQDREQA